MAASQNTPKPANKLKNGFYEPSSGFPPQLKNLMFGFCGSQALFAASELGIFETLDTSEKPMSAESLSKTLGTDLDATCRLLDALVCIELLEKVPQTTKSTKNSSESSAMYSNTYVTKQFLLSNSPQSVKPSMGFGGKVLYQLFGNLSWAVREGSNQWGRTFNCPSAEDFFTASYATKEGVIRVMEGMRGTCKPAAPDVVTAFDLSRFNKMCDLGGCTGDIAYAASTAYPKLQIIVLDLPPVVECAPNFRLPLEECPNQKNVSFVSADFFKDDLPTADLYVLTHILHDWGDDKIDLLLKKVFTSLPSGGGLLIGELLLTDSKTGPFEGVVASLSMLVLCDKGARERSEAEFRELLERHGFVDVKARRTGSILMDAILCRKP